MSFVNSPLIILKVNPHVQTLLLATEAFDNNPPSPTLITTETFVNPIPPMEEVVTETFANDPPVMEIVSTEDFGGYTLNHNVGVFTEPSFLAANAQPYDIRDNASGSIVHPNGLWGYIGTRYFYPGRDHVLHAPTTITDNNGCIWDIDDPTPFVFSTNYTSDTTIFVGYHKRDPLCPSS